MNHDRTDRVFIPWGRETVRCIVFSFSVAKILTPPLLFECSGVLLRTSQNTIDTSLIQ